MHIPENYLSPSTAGILDVVMIPIWVVAARKVSKTVPRDKLPLLGIAAAFCFVAMMFNIPLPGGTSGHAVCGTLIAILFGPWAATIAVSIALAIQALLFGDGGVIALGANCFNMAFVLPMIGYAIYRAITKAVKGTGGKLVGAAVGSYIAINVAALLAAIEFGIQPLLFTDANGLALYCPYPLSVSIPAMMLGHLTIAGLAEVVFTVGILAFILKVSPGFVIDEDNGVAPRVAPVAILVAVLVVLTPLGLIQTFDAWGEWGLEDLAAAAGYAPAGMAGGWEWSALCPDYAIGALPEVAGYILSAVIGVLLLVIIFRLLAGPQKKSADFNA